MRLYPWFLLVELVAFNLNAEFSEKPKALELNKMAAEVHKVLEPHDVAGISARIRVEDAQFRAFNLFLPPFEMGAVGPTERKSAHDIRQVLERDLDITGSFQIMSGAGAGKLGTDELLKQKGAEGVSRCQLSFRGQKISAVIEHKNFSNNKTTRKFFEVSPAQFRRLAHLLAQSIFEEFVGPEDLFLLQIAAVKRSKNYSQIVLFDFDGFNETTISTGPWTKSAPYFSPDGKSILYSVTSDEKKGIVEQNIGIPTSQFRVSVSGLNLDPRVLPDNSGLLAALSFSGKALNIYKTTREGKIIGPVTSPLGLNLSPTISSDGKYMAFVSTRGGSPQIYEQALGGNAGEIAPAIRLTTKGEYNQTPHYSPDGRLVAFTGRDQKAVFDVFIYERATKSFSRVTQNQGRNQEPFFTPSGRFVIFASQRDGKQEPDIYLANLNGNHQRRLTSSGGYYSPVVRPLQK